MDDALRRLYAADAAGRPSDPEGHDNYGGEAGLLALADAAGVGADDRVVDLGAGWGGPACTLAGRRGCRVAAVELSRVRAVAAQRRVSDRQAGDLVGVVCADLTAVPLRSSSATAVLSVDTFLHVVDAGAVARECRRLLAPGGRLAFEDWVVTGPLAPADAGALARSFAVPRPRSLLDYGRVLAAEGFGAVTLTDLSAAWLLAVDARLRHLHAERETLVDRYGEDEWRRWDERYGLLVRLAASGSLGRVRVVTAVAEVAGG